MHSTEEFAISIVSPLGARECAPNVYVVCCDKSEGCTRKARRKKRTDHVIGVEKPYRRNPHLCAKPPRRHDLLQ